MSSAPQKEARSAFDKMRPAQMTDEELSIVEQILSIEIAMAVRSMGKATDWQESDLTMFCEQVLDGFKVRYSKHSLSTMLLFFKMRRARIAPCDKGTFGVNPVVILDEFNEFIKWQNDIVSIPHGYKDSASLNERSSLLAKALKDAPEEIQQQFKDLKKSLDEKAKLSKKQSSYTTQFMRLTSNLMAKHGDRETAVKKAKEMVLEWGIVHGDGNELKRKIDEVYPPAPERDKSISITHSICGKIIVQHKDNITHKLHHINSDKQL